ncbi:hypothetical protein BDV59DRAFT_167152 [Aspergillus ambiguus]|uniref:uncharacterized protein n=1 Tax=Aspergillus ambiguus TaxID=176160 RepID=UPI003CCCCA42
MPNVGPCCTRIPDKSNHFFPLRHPELVSESAVYNHDAMPFLSLLFFVGLIVVAWRLYI